MTATILYTTPFAELVGGGQVSLLLLLEGLDRGRFSPLVLVPAEGEVARRARSLGCEVEVQELPPLRRPWRVPGGVLRLRRLLRARRVALIHAEQPRSVVYAALARAGLGIPLVWHVRTMIHDRLDPFLERAADALVLVAEALRERFSDAGRRKSVVVYNGVEVPAGKSEAGNGARLVILCPGRLERDKGQHLLLEAVVALSSEFPTVEVWLAGRADESYLAQLRALAAPLGARARFLGYREDAAALAAQADVVALPSAHEAFPRAVLEAMAAGKPVVATRVGGVAEAVEDGRTGLLFPRGDAAALAAALRRVLGDEALRLSMGEEGRERARRFSTRAMVEGVERLYGRLLSPAGEAAPC